MAAIFIGTIGQLYFQQFACDVEVEIDKFIYSSGSLLFQVDEVISLLFLGIKPRASRLLRQVFYHLAIPLVPE